MLFNMYNMGMTSDAHLNGILEFLDSGHKCWTLGSGCCTLDAGLWTLDPGP